jgi:hypothetical protein
MEEAHLVQLRTETRRGSDRLPQRFRLHAMSLATCATGRPDALANPVPRMIGSFGYFLALGIAGESHLQRDRSSQSDRSIRGQLTAGETVFRFRRACDPGRRERRLGAGTRTHRACFACATRSRFRDRLRVRSGREPSVSAMGNRLLFGSGNWEALRRRRSSPC